MYQMIYRISINLYRYEYRIEKNDRYPALLHGPSMLPDKAKSVVCSIISIALSFWMKHLVIGQLQKPAKFSAFHRSTSRSHAFIGQLLGTSRVVHLPKRTVLVLFTISDA